MIKENALADPRRRVDVRLEDAGRTALQIEREITAPTCIKPMGQAMRLDRMEPLEIEHRLQEAQACRIAIVKCLDIDPEDGTPFRPVIQHFHECLTQQNRLQIRMIETLADPVNDTFFQGTMVQHGGIEKRRKKRIMLDGKPRFLLQRIPYRIDRRDGFFDANVHS
ncbi:hypothetical protein D3C80_641140 [compost metagenome]